VSPVVTFSPPRPAFQAKPEVDFMTMREFLQLINQFEGNNGGGGHQLYGNSTFLPICHALFFNCVPPTRVV